MRNVNLLFRTDKKNPNQMLGIISKGGGEKQNIIMPYNKALVHLPLEYFVQRGSNAKIVQ